MIHLKKEKRRTKALVRDYIGKTVFLRREVSIPILRVGVQQMKKEAISKLISVSIPILRVGVQLQAHSAPHQLSGFQFPYCAWEFNVSGGARSLKVKGFNSHTARGSSTSGQQHVGCNHPVSIPILHVGVQHGVCHPDDAEHG